MDFRNLFSGLWNGVSLMGHSLGAKELWDLVKGGVLPTSEDLKAKGWKGVFGLGDEQTFDALLLDIDKDTNGNCTGYREAILSYKAWLFRTTANADAYEHLVLWYYSNKWRNYILGMPVSDVKMIPLKETRTVNAAGKTETTVTESQQATAQKDYPREWLMFYAKKIIAGKENKIPTFKKILQEHMTIGVPTPPKTRVGKMIASRRIVKQLGSGILGRAVHVKNKLRDSTHERAAQIQKNNANEWTFIKAIRWLIS
jgi:hypothetical protein